MDKMLGPGREEASIGMQKALLALQSRASYYFLIFSPPPGDFAFSMSPSLPRALVKVDRFKPATMVVASYPLS
jgi:hypothetical protein